MAQAKKEEKKVKRPTALKRDIQSEKKRLRNRQYKSSVRTAIRSLDDVISQGDKAKAQTHLNEVYSILDKGVKKGIIKSNQASRTKSRLAARAAK